MKKRLHKFFAIFLCCVFALLCVGCAGNDSGFSDNLDQMLDNGELSEDEYLQKRMEAMSVPLYGSKVLYRPDDYDWSQNVGSGNENYYEQYAWWLLRELSSRYTFLDLSDQLLYGDGDEIPAVLDTPKENQPMGYYDSMRYQMKSFDIIHLQKIKLDESNHPESDPAETKTYLKISADTSKQWNWSLGGQIYSTDETIEEPLNQAYIYDTENFNRKPNFDEIIPIPSDGILFGDQYYPSNEAEIKGNIVSNVNADRTITDDFYEKYMEYLKSHLNDHYSPMAYQNTFSQIYLGTDYRLTRDDLAPDESTSQDFSDYVKAMEYAIYCINLDLTPNSISVTYDAKGLPIVQVDRYPAQDGKSSASVALEEIQSLFKQIGTYVGVTERQQVRLVNWICDNVIGRQDETFLSDDTFTITSTERTLVQYVKEVDSGQDLDGDQQNDMIEVMCDENGNPVTEFSPKEITTGSTADVAKVERDYYDTVNTIVDICTKQVNIGNSNPEGGDPTEDDPHINDKYPASNIVDFFGNDFFYHSDHKFPNEPDEFPIQKIDDPTKLQPGPLEYQSVVLMMSREFSFSNLWMAFKYDAGMDGDTVYDQNNSITINIHLHLYTHEDNNYRNIGIIADGEFYDTFQVEVKDGPFSYGETTATAMFNGLCEIKDGEYGYGGYAPRCKPFNYNVGGGVLKSIDYDYLMQFFLTKQKTGVPLPLNGNDKRRNYYKLVDGEVDDEKYYSYGILNPDMFAGADGSDYFEIAFEVVKVKTADPAQVKNYKFYTGLLLMDADNMV